MAKVRIEPWEISTKSPADDFCQSIFFTGNGVLGVRGFAGHEQKKNPQEHGIFRAGLFDDIKPGITDMVQLPDVLTLRLWDDDPESLHQTLDMRRGILTQSWENERAGVTFERAVSMSDSQLILQQLTVTAKQAGLFTVESIADAAVKNLPVHDDQMIKSTDLIMLLEVDVIQEDGLHMHTVPTGHAVDIHWELSSSQPAETATKINGEKVTACFTRSLAKGETWTVEKRVRVLIKGDNAHEKEPDPWAAHMQKWAALWEDCDIQLDAEDALQGAVRYNIYQMLCNNAADDRTASIGARGLTHGRYKGNTFWDTEIFLFPFYLYTRPDAAKNLMLYRADKLNDAKALAAKQNLGGARYPWMCSFTGHEQCESWDIGFCETHITADVAYAMQQYAIVTGDEAFVKEHAVSVWGETARYWLSRLTWEEAAGQYSTFFVKGPDEYCGAAVNNTYTNYMARNNISLALAYSPLDPAERQKMQHVKDHIAILYDENRGLYLQDELLDRLEPYPFSMDSDRPAYKQVCFDRMQRYKVLKQADLVLLMTLFPNDFTQQQKRNVFDCYEPITLHDSTLSYGVHAQLALTLGLFDKAEAYLHKGIYLDLYDVMENTGHEGIHMAALGSAWQALVFGAAGLSIHEDGTVKAVPHLPPSIRAMHFQVKVRGRKHKVSVFASGAAEVQAIL